MHVKNYQIKVGLPQTLTDLWIIQFSLTKYLGVQIGDSKIGKYIAKMFNACSSRHIFITQSRQNLYYYLDRFFFEFFLLTALFTAVSYNPSKYSIADNFAFSLAINIFILLFAPNPGAAVAPVGFLSLIFYIDSCLAVSSMEPLQITASTSFVILLLVPQPIYKYIYRYLMEDCNEFIMTYLIY